MVRLVRQLKQPQRVIRSVANHGKHNGHHGQLPILKRPVVVDMSTPSTIKRDDTPGIDRAAKDVLGHKLALIPEYDLLSKRRPVACASSCVHGMFSIPHTRKPIRVALRRRRLGGMLEPFVDEDVGSIVVQRLAHKFAHRDGRGLEFRVVALSHFGTAAAIFVLGSADVK